MKKIFISCLIMTLMLTNISLVNISSVQAATTDNVVTTTENTIKISLDNIRDIVIENNLDLKIADNNLKITKEKRDDAKSTYEGKTEPTDSDKPQSSDSKYATDDANHTAYNADKAVYDKSVTDYNAAKKDYETTKNNYKTAKTNYDQKVESVVYSAQTAYLNYLSDLATQKLNEDTVKTNEKEAKVYKLQYDSGFISKNTYIDNLQKNTSVNDLNSSKDKVELERIQLCNTLGISPEEKMIFNTEINEDFQVISKINYENDLNQMLDNNFDIKDKNDAIDDLDDEKDDDTDIYDYNVDNAEISLKQAINTAETDFKGKYNDLITSYNSIKSSYDVIIQEQKEYQVTQTQYDYGFISQNGLDAKKLKLDTDIASFIKSRNSCYLLYLKYIEMKEGY
ncbi:hypothetical protein psyc5s11_21180 [Clostridium gelidum]|uniref:Outer membrane efflux protein n=1 Tax=Clostridium gelidum TaxID=704125 RepID=A0ABN6IZA8_9CLOT|nr:TolC family protein [Clostridium gelidum]BCZ46051.1 hypothetical protein psyc5s11_21180 [Clostridium gelidum]